MPRVITVLSGVINEAECSYVSLLSRAHNKLFLPLQVSGVLEVEVQGASSLDGPVGDPWRAAQQLLLWCGVRTRRDGRLDLRHHQVRPLVRVQQQAVAGQVGRAEGEYSEKTRLALGSVKAKNSFEIRLLLRLTRCSMAALVPIER